MTKVGQKPSLECCKTNAPKNSMYRVQNGRYGHNRESHFMLISHESLCQRLLGAKPQFASTKWCTRPLVILQQLP